MYPYVFQTPTFSLRWENVLIVIGVVLAIWMAERRAAYKGRAYQDMLLDLYLWLIPAGVVGGRLWDVAFTWDTYRDRPWDVLAFWNGGMSIQGCILGGLVAALLFAWRRQIRVWELLDILTPPVLMAQALGRLGCVLSGDAFGRPVSEVKWWPAWLSLVYAKESPAYLVFGSTPLIPAEALEGLLDFVILALLLWYKPRREVPGRTVLVYTLLYSVARFGLEFLRADSLMLAGVKVAQLLSAAVILVSAALLAVRYRKTNAMTNEAAG